MADYKVCRTNSKTTVPCGMNAMLYYGTSLKQATKAFNEAKTGLDAWSNSNTTYGVVLSVYKLESRDFIVIRHKGFA